MKALLISEDNIEELKLKYDFEKIIYEKEDEKHGKSVDYIEDETDEAVGKYFIDEWAAFPRGYGVVSAEVFNSEFVALEGDSLKDHAWFEIEKKPNHNWQHS